MFVSSASTSCHVCLSAASIVCLHWSYSSFWDCWVRFTSCMFVSSASTDHTALSETVEWGSQVVCLYRLPPLIIQLFLRLLSSVHKLYVCIVCLHWSYSSFWDCWVRFTSCMFVSSASTDHTALSWDCRVRFTSCMFVSLCLRLLSEVHKLYVCIVCLHWSYSSFWDCWVRFTSCMFVSSASTDHTALPETVEWGLQVVCLCRLPPLIIQLFLRLLSEVHKLYVCIVCLHWTYTSFWDCWVRFTSCMFVSSASTDHTALSETVEWGSQVVCLYRLPPLIIQLFLRLLSEVHKLCVCIVCIHWSYSSVWDCRVRFTSYVFVSSASTDHTALALSETVEWGSQVVCLYRLPPLIIQLCLRL